MKEYDGRIRLILKDRPLAGHALARPAHEAARCAGVKGKYWEYHDRLFEEQPAFTRDALLLYATDVGLERAEFARCVDERRFAEEVEADVQQALALGITRTPTLLVNRLRVVGAPRLEQFRNIIEQALRERR